MLLFFFSKSYPVDANAKTVAVEFAWDMDYSAIVGTSEANKTEFINHITPQLASEMGVDEDRITDVDIWEGK